MYVHTFISYLSRFLCVRVDERCTHTHTTDSVRNCNHLSACIHQTTTIMRMKFFFVTHCAQRAEVCEKEWNKESIILGELCSIPKTMRILYVCVCVYPSVFKAFTDGVGSKRRKLIEKWQKGIEMKMCND